jgi:endonuclease/exonuclease/phosphatase family metal-dependent hydrolase
MDRIGGNPIFAAASQFALFAAVGNGWAQVQSNDFPARVEAIADEIATAKPDLVGLQEAELYRTDVPPDGPATPAGTVAYDYFDLLLDALADRGLSYERVAVFDGTDVELPAGLPPTLDVRFTDRVALIARTDEKTSDPKLSNPLSGRYPTALTLNTVFGQLTAPRAPLTKRVDLVLTRGGFDTVSAAVVGEQLADRTPSGLWPSDHAGVVATLQLP